MRAFWFYALLSLPIVAWAGFVTLHLVSFDMLSAVVYAVVAISPLIGGDVSIVGELTPVLLAGSIVAMAPQSRAVNVPPILLAVLSYALYLHLSVYFSSAGGAALISDHFSGERATDAKKVILNFISNIRTTSIVVAASMIGFKVKGQE